MHLAPTGKNEENLVRENVAADQVFVTGNTGIDALQWASGLDVPIADPAVAELRRRRRAASSLVTAHRRENWGGGLARDRRGRRRLAEGASRRALSWSRCTRTRACGEVLRPLLEPLANVVLTEPLRYTTIARVLGALHLVITDSGGLQEEAPSLGKPVLVARESTERIEGVEAGTLRLVGTDPDHIVAGGAAPAGRPRTRTGRWRPPQNPYGDGHAAERIVAAHEHLLTGGDPRRAFGAGYTRLAVLAALGYDGWLRPLEEEPVDEAGPSTSRTTAAHDRSRSACRSTGCRCSGSCSSPRRSR